MIDSTDKFNAVDKNIRQCKKSNGVDITLVDVFRILDVIDYWHGDLTKNFHFTMFVLVETL